MHFITKKKWRQKEKNSIPVLFSVKIILPWNLSYIVANLDFNRYNFFIFLIKKKFYKKLKWKFILLTQALYCHLLCFSFHSHKLWGWSVCVWNSWILPRSRQRQKCVFAGWRLRDNAVCHPAELTGVQKKPGAFIRINGGAWKLGLSLASVFG